MGLVYIDEKILKEDQAEIFLSEGFLYGYGLFETMRAYEGKIFCLDLHIERLISSSFLIDLKPPHKSLIIKKIKEILRKEKIPNAYIRINLWKQGQASKFCIILREYTPYPTEVYKRVFRCITSKFRQNEYSVLSKIKSLNYLNNRLALRQAKERNCDEAIILNTKGYLCEGTRTNLFLIKNSKVFTPSLDCGCLEGITRNKVIEIAKKEELKVYEEKLFIEDLYNADEAFLTNSLIEIMPLTFLDERPINKGIPGEMTNLLLNRYRRLVLK